MEIQHEARALAAQIQRIDAENQELTHKLRRLYNDYRYLQMQAKSLMPATRSGSSREDETAPNLLLPWKKRKLGENASGAVRNQEDDYESSAQEIAETTHHQQQKLPTRKMICMRTDSQSSTINDGCQWRKYGQKMTRNNTQPRSYYRCAMAPGCTVKKQVQRCGHDPSLVVTTYEGNHSHPLSPLAMSIMAAASEELLPSHSPFLHTHNSIIAATHPTVTLDLTSQTNSQQKPGIGMDAHFTEAVAMAVANTVLKSIQANSPLSSNNPPISAVTTKPLFVEKPLSR